jgi:hypothetical protein
VIFAEKHGLEYDAPLLFYHGPSRRILVILPKKHGLEYDAREQPMYRQILEITAGCKLTYFTAGCILAASIHKTRFLKKQLAISTLSPVARGWKRACKAGRQAGHARHVPGEHLGVARVE